MLIRRKVKSAAEAGEEPRDSRLGGEGAVAANDVS